MSQLPPGSCGLPFIGEALKFLKDPFWFTLSRTRQHGTIWRTKLLGDTVVFFAGPKAFSFFMDPENFTRQSGSPKFMQELLHPDAVPFLDGDRHKARKRLLLAAFTDVALDSYLPNLFTIFERFVTGWVTASAATDIAIADDLSQFGFDVADMLFAASDPLTSNTTSADDFTTLIKGSFAPPINLPFTAYGRGIKARDRLRTYIGQQTAKSGEGSALGVLKNARGPAGEQLSQAELEIEMLHFFFAAHGGLTAAIAWILTVLGEHPELAGRLRAEADAKLTDAVPDLATIRGLSQARSVSREVLRAFPIAPSTFLGIAKKDLELDGYTIRAGWKGAGAIWATLQDGTTFADPTVFRGDRLGDDAMNALPHNAFVPQGGGHADGHRCAGEALIQLVMPAFASWFVRRYDLTWPAQDSAPGRGGLGPLPRSGVRVAIKPRAS
ncbi:MAG: cytochrome P450 [Deltaproteobacteria bacterium]|nr:cytochrome P450 [Deltaproteobacteria bacterium]